MLVPSSEVSWEGPGVHLRHLRSGHSVHGLHVQAGVQRVRLSVCLKYISVHSELPIEKRNVCDTTRQKSQLHNHGHLAVTTIKVCELIYMKAQEFPLAAGVTIMILQSMSVIL